MSSSGLETTSRLTLFVAKGQRAHGLDLRGADLGSADLSTLCADGLDLRAANLAKAKLIKTRFEGCRMERAIFSDADWSDATLRLCALDGAQGTGTRFDNSRLEDSSVKGADLTGASLRNARLTETSFERAILRDAILDSAEGEGVEFRGADLAGASLIGVRFEDADFRGADLRKADLSRALVRGADFRGAILEGASFDGTDYEGARFDDGEGPRAEAAAQASTPENEQFDGIAASVLREGLTSLPAIFAARGGATAEFIDRLQEVVDGLKSDSHTPPEEWKPWLEPLLKVARREQPLDPRELLDALCKAPAGLQTLFAGNDASNARELLDRLRQAVSALDSASGQPPEEWKPWLEPLMKVSSETQPFDLKALLEALSQAAQRPPADAGEQKPTQDSPDSARHG